MSTYPYETVGSFVAKLKLLDPKTSVNFDVKTRQVVIVNYTNSLYKITHEFETEKWDCIAFLNTNSNGSKVSEVLEYLEPFGETHKESIVALMKHNTDSAQFYFIDNGSSVHSFLMLEEETWGRSQKWANCHLAENSKIEHAKAMILKKAEKVNTIICGDRNLFNLYVTTTLAPKYPKIKMASFDGTIFFNTTDITEYCKQLGKVVKYHEIVICNSTQEDREQWITAAKAIQEAASSKQKPAQNSSVTISENPKDTIVTFDFVGDKGQISITQPESDRISSPVPSCPWVPSPLYDSVPDLIPQIPVLQTPIPRSPIPLISIPDFIPKMPRLASPKPVSPRPVSPRPASPRPVSPKPIPQTPISQTKYQIDNTTFNSLSELTQTYDLTADSIKSLFVPTPTNPNLWICKLNADIMSGFKL